MGRKIVYYVFWKEGKKKNIKIAQFLFLMSWFEVTRKYLLSGYPIGSGDQKTQGVFKKEKKNYGMMEWRTKTWTDSWMEATDIGDDWKSYLVFVKLHKLS